MEEVEISQRGGGEMVLQPQLLGKGFPVEIRQNNLFPGYFPGFVDLLFSSSGC